MRVPAGAPSIGSGAASTTLIESSICSAVSRRTMPREKFVSSSPFVAFGSEASW